VGKRVLARLNAENGLPFDTRGGKRSERGKHDELRGKSLRLTDGRKERKRPARAEGKNGGGKKG